MCRACCVHGGFLCAIAYAGINEGRRKASGVMNQSSDAFVYGEVQNLFEEQRNDQRARQRRRYIRAWLRAYTTSHQLPQLSPRRRIFAFCRADRSVQRDMFNSWRESFVCRSLCSRLDLSMISTTRPPLSYMEVSAYQSGRF